MSEEVIDTGTDALDEMFGNADTGNEFEKEQASHSEGKEDASSVMEDASGGDEQEQVGGENSVEEQAPVLSDDELLKALDPVESPEQKAARLERDYKASSKEAQRLVSERKAMEKVLEEQGLKLSMKGGKVSLFPTEKYSAEGKLFEAKVDLLDLRGPDLDAMESGILEDQQRVFDKLLSKVTEDARRELARPAPTHAKEPAHLSEERRESVFNAMADSKDEFNQERYPSISANRPVIEAFINNSARPQVLREAFAEAPELMAELVNSHINGVRSTLIKRVEAAKAEAKKKQQEARNKADQGVSGEGVVTPVKGGEGGYLDTMFS